MIESDPILVSICCVTYNHANYIADSISGFLLQKTKFKYEIILHDDASTDGTAEIIKEYSRKYPDLIFPIYQSINQYSKCKYSVLKNFILPIAKGKYIALCEGDDYWIDPNKLQKQVDFLEGNREYSMCFHSANIISEDPELAKINLYKSLSHKDFKSEELLRHWVVPTASMVFRRDFANLIPWSPKFIYQDIVIVLTMAEHGKVRCLEGVMSAYRRTPTGSVLSQRHDPSYFLSFIEHYEEILKSFSKINESTIRELLIERFAGLCLSYLRYNQKKQFIVCFINTFNLYRFPFLKALLKNAFNSVRFKISKLKNII